MDFGRNGFNNDAMDEYRLEKARVIAGFDRELARGMNIGQAVVAGGLNPTNVASVVRELRPWGVDTAGGESSASLAKASSVSSSSRMSSCAIRAPRVTTNEDQVISKPHQSS